MYFFLAFVRLFVSNSASIAWKTRFWNDITCRVGRWPLLTHWLAENIVKLCGII